MRLALPFALTLALVLAAPAAARAQEGAAPEAPTAAPAQAPTAAPAQAPSAAPAPSDIPEGFERVSGPAAAQAKVDAPPLVVAAYLFIWGMTFLYVVVLWRRQRRLKAELEALEARLREVTGRNRAA